jgi:uncharacterized protein
VVALSPMSAPEFAANDADRCYYCKRFLFSSLLEFARAEGYAHVLEGGNVDDLRDHRPGMRAVNELGVRAPLRELGIGKAAIREMARAWGLPNWDAPSAACLASRIPYGQTITIEKLRRVESAEDFLRTTFALRVLRVRHDGPTARIETAPEDIARLAAPDARHAIVLRLRDLGFLYVSLDLTGYRTGSLNEAL